MHTGISRHIIPVVTALPPTGLPNQMIQYQGIVYIWVEGYQEWNPLIGHTTQVKQADALLTSSTSETKIGEFPVKADGIYEVEWKTILSHESAVAGSFYSMFSLPAGAVFQGMIEEHRVATGNDVVGNLQLSANSLIQSGSVPANATLQLHGSGLIKMGATAGQCWYGMAKLSTNLRLRKGSYFIYRRIG